MMGENKLRQTITSLKLKQTRVLGACLDDDDDDDEEARVESGNNGGG